jgi:hypothetical protein
MCSKYHKCIFSLKSVRWWPDGLKIARLLIKLIAVLSQIQFPRNPLEKIKREAEKNWPCFCNYKIVSIVYQILFGLP